MKIFDCHCHIEKGLENYDLLGVSHRNIIFNSITDYKDHIGKVSAEDTVSLVFDFKYNFQFVNDTIKAGKIDALKIISRDQKLSEEDYPELIAKLEEVGERLPIIIDAFYYGHNLKYQPSLSSIIDIASHFPNRKIIVAHSGGHKVLDYFFHLRTLKNIYYDLSFSLQYLSDSSCYIDFVKLIKYSDRTKILYGSDYNWASPKLQFEVLEGIFQKLNFSDSDKELIYFYNSFNLFKGNKLSL
jgi:predicted TIM-barrel fold metal-dependent hydrolase